MQEASRHTYQLKPYLVVLLERDYMNNTTRPEDGEAEKMIASFLGEFFYPKLKVLNQISDWRSITVEKEQLAGADVELYLQGNKKIVDEKAAIQYTNIGLPTFAFELSQTVSSGEVVDGWFMNAALNTTHFILVWPYSDSATEEPALSKNDCLTWLEVALIEKSKLLDKLKEIGLSQDILKMEAKIFRTEVGKGAKKRKVLNEEWNLVLHYFDKSKFSDEPIIERPIILTIGKRKILFPLSELRYHVYPDKLWELSPNGIRKVEILFKDGVFLGSRTNELIVQVL